MFPRIPCGRDQLRPKIRLMNAPTKACESAQLAYRLRRRWMPEGGGGGVGSCSGEHPLPLPFAVTAVSGGAGWAGWGPGSGPVWDNRLSRSEVPAHPPPAATAVRPTAVRRRPQPGDGGAEGVGETAGPSQDVPMGLGTAMYRWCEPGFGTGCVIPGSYCIKAQTQRSHKKARLYQFDGTMSTAQLLNHCQGLIRETDTRASFVGDRIPLDPDTIRSLRSRIRLDLLPYCEGGSMIPVDLSANCKGWMNNPNGSGIQILRIRSRDPFSGSTDMSGSQSE